METAPSFSLKCSLSPKAEAELESERRNVMAAIAPDVDVRGGEGEATGQDDAGNEGVIRTHIHTHIHTHTSFVQSQQAIARVYRLST